MRKVLWSAAVLGAPDTLPPSPPAEEAPPYVYAASDIRPRQSREIELCEKASHFDWEYTGAFVLGFGASLYLDVGVLKQQTEAPVRLMGPLLIGFSFGGLMSGGYLSLPKCDPMWAEGPPPEGNVRVVWPLATMIAVLGGVMGPFMDWIFIGPPRPEWAVVERSARVFVAAGGGVLGSLFPYLLPPRTWAARRQIERMRVEGTLGGAAMTYTLKF